MFKRIFYLFLLGAVLWLSPCYTSNVIPASNLSATNSNLSNTKIDWWLVRAKNHQTPGFNDKLSFKLSDYDAFGVGDTSQPVIYLTFDEGYENGYTPKILDVLKSTDTKATFFVTLPYINQNPDLIKRMQEEGHLVGNHSNHHKSMPSLTGNPESFNAEFTTVSDAYTAITGTNMPHFFRPPMGHYSERSLAMTKDLGYKTVFWSFAYGDWKPEAQPNPAQAKQLMIDNLHNGAIYLLHAVSKTNADVLTDFINTAKSMGYTFELLPE